MEQYLNLLKEILTRGDVQYEPRTEEYTIGISSFSSTYDLRKGFPLLTTKNVPSRLPFEELFWKLRGERNVKTLVDKNVNIWTANAFDRYLKTNGLNEKIPKHSSQWNEEFEKYSQRIKDDPKFAEKAGDLGPVYGYQWRHWPVKREGWGLLRQFFNEAIAGKKEKVDQLETLLKGIKKSPGSRYHVLSAWNVSQLHEMALGPCPFWHQFSVFGDNLDLTMVQRSNDSYLGDPFNQAQDALLLEMVAKETGFKPRFFNYQTINTHIYLGVVPRSDFWKNEKNIKEFQNNFKEISKREEYLNLREWYLNQVPAESEGNERKDHLPFVLEQLSKEPKELPFLKIEKDIPLLEAIQMSPLDVVKVNGYNPHKWDSKAEMAA
ncbi:MAG: thymidylate synthase [Candidatus Diapherotrites archaeon]